ncbi:unnamed protein product [Prorocentrum cordatum]|uniref:Kinesin motor domain-containing protein n=1 Tax=Prorocentrum cordatum TaxID=2364126 RepID=A0ABN9QWG6_9DINO|nr:unnamed protein product [Polarella glacialis]
MLDGRRGHRGPGGGAALHARPAAAELGKQQHGRGGRRGPGGGAALHDGPAELILTNTALGDAGAEALARAPPSTPALRTLYPHNNALCDAGAEALVLFSNGNNISDGANDAMRDAWGDRKGHLHVGTWPPGQTMKSVRCDCSARFSVQLQINEHDPVAGVNKYVFAGVSGVDGDTDACGIVAMADGGRVQVFARVRPVGGNEGAASCCVEADGDDGTVLVRDEAAALERVARGEGVESAIGSVEGRQFSFDGAFGRGCSQRDIFAQVGAPVLRECMNGFNGTILAYGQTGSGKTFSLLNQAQGGEDTGLLPRLVAGLYVQVARDRANVYQVDAAALQVYNEQVDDLLAPGHHDGVGHGLPVQNGGSVPNLTWIECTRPDQMLETFSRARANLIYAETKMNKASSRSHAVFQMRITRCARAGAAAANGAPKRMEGTRSIFTVVDLAGSERVKKSGAEGARFQEAAAINKSLLALGNVVSALAAKKKHVPTRDSKLTRLLEGSLGGNCKTSLLVCVSPALENQGETLCTLDFASRAMCVEVDAKVNDTVVEVSAQALVADLSTTMPGLHLGSELDELRKTTGQAVERAEEEARRQRQAADAAHCERQRLRTEAEEATRRARSRDAEVQALRDECQQSRDEAHSLRRSVKRLEGEVRRLSEDAADAQGLSGDLQDARQAQAEAELETARLRRQVQQLEERVAELLAVSEEQNQEMTRLTQLADDLSRQLKEQHTACTGAGEKARAAEEELQRVCVERDGLVKRATTAEAAQAEQSSAAAAAAERAQSTEAKLAKISEERDQLLERAGASEAALTREAARAEVERSALSAELAEAREQHGAQAAQLSQLRLESTEAIRRRQALEADLARTGQELELRTGELERAAAELQSARAACESTAEALRDSHSAERQLAATAHSAEVARLQGEWAAQRQSLESSLQTAREECARTAAEAEARAREESSRSEAERAALASSMEERVRALEAERAELRLQLEGKCRELRESEARWRDSKEQEVQKAWEAGNQQQRRLAAAFKAARCLSAAKEAAAKEAHDALANRFASREEPPRGHERARAAEEGPPGPGAGHRAGQDGAEEP